MKPILIRLAARKVLLFVPVLLFFMQFGLFVRYGTSKGMFGSLLFHAVNEKWDTVAHALVKLGADVNFQACGFDVTNFSRTPLSVAAYRGDEEMVALLLKHGAKVKEDVLNGLYTALGNAAAGNSAGSVELLINYGADINRQDRLGRTPIRLAVERKALDSIDVLWLRGARLDIADENGVSALDAMLKEDFFSEFLIARKNRLPADISIAY